MEGTDNLICARMSRDADPARGTDVRLAVSGPLHVFDAKTGKRVA